jgi:hypothetical protein
MKATRGDRNTLAALVIFTLACLSGCATDKTLTAAKERTRTKDDGEVVVDREAQPGYYALLPFAVGADIVLSPAYVIWYGIALGRGKADTF